MLKAERRRENSSSYCGASLKRMIDIVAAGLGLVLLAPALSVIAILIRLTMGHPVLFRHARAGLMGKPFTLYKFRTMWDAYGPDGQPLPDAERLTRLGWNLRRMSLDELPQLWNVLRGDMSLVGPRPLLMEYLPRYTPEQARRHQVRPGITGWAQVNGRNSLPWEEKFQQDIWYVDHQSLWIDAKIIIMTIIRVVQRRGISHNNHATAPKFVPSHRAHEGVRTDSTS
jgi:sugar transferase EpsL